MVRIGILAALGLLTLSGAALAQPKVESNSWWRAYETAPFARTADGRRLRVYCLGSGGPTVVLESGLGDGAWSWRSVQPAIAKQTRVCSYDRAGLGLSDEAHGLRDLDAMASDLAAVVKMAGRGKPVVLVAHSLGGPIVRQYAYRHPEKVAGFVLVDPSADHQNERFRAIVPDFDKINRVNYAPLQHCLALLEKGAIAEGAPEYPLCIAKPPADMPADLVHFHYQYNQSPIHDREVMAELDAQTSGANDKAADAARHPLGDKPLLVLTAGITPPVPGISAAQKAEFGQAWYEMHNEIAALSTRGRQRIVPGASHYIQGEKPQVVVEAVSEVLSEVRGR
jgi:pimeloyl-ACP methyl ester carboxylesterase